MITALIICGTVVLCLLVLLKWVTDMSREGLPMFTYGECIQKEQDEDIPSSAKIGFTPPEEPEQPKEKTDKEQKDAVLKDPITMFSALLRGEVDIDELSI